jgi:hypothetical protein
MIWRRSRFLGGGRARRWYPGRQPCGPGPRGGPSAALAAACGMQGAVRASDNALVLRRMFRYSAARHQAVSQACAPVLFAPTGVTDVNTSVSGVEAAATIADAYAVFSRSAVADAEAGVSVADPGVLHGDTSVQDTEPVGSAIEPVVMVAATLAPAGKAGVLKANTSVKAKGTPVQGHGTRVACTCVPAAEHWKGW